MRIHRSRFANSAQCLESLYDSTNCMVFLRESLMSAGLSCGHAAQTSSERGLDATCSSTCAQIKCSYFINHRVKPSTLKCYHL